MRIASTAASGVALAALRLEVSAANTANVSTPGHRGARVVAEARAGGGVAAHVERPELASVGRVEPSGDPSDVDVADEAIAESVARHGLAACLACWRAADETLAALVSRHR